MSDQHRQAARLATASLNDLVGRANAIQAEILRGADAAAIEAQRQDALTVAEAYIDKSIEAAQAARAILEP